MSARKLDYFNRIQFVSASGATNPAMSGTNTITTDTGLTNAADIIEQNKEFIVQDCFGLLQLYSQILQATCYVLEMTYKVSYVQ